MYSEIFDVDSESGVGFNFKKLEILRVHSENYDAETYSSAHKKCTGAGLYREAVLIMPVLVFNKFQVFHLDKST